jgi:hypothetical protein
MKDYYHIQYRCDSKAIDLSIRKMMELFIAMVLPR